MNKNEKKSPHNFFLHCDACHHEVDFEGKMTRAHIGYACPKCGADMLTESDFKAGARIQRVMVFFKWLGLMKRADRNTKPGENEELVRTHYHNGKTMVEKLDGSL